MQSSLVRSLFARQEAKSGTDELVDLLSGGFEGQVRSHNFHKDANTNVIGLMTITAF